ncbi:uncharacterized protein G2W53_041699 [Senna tora]|uniref:Uncharacterized protein n=1 Tax=Senna tora TaxID=362788 RepID=A0A834SHV5_9FABA|nr:uncharacterized protein G2W53_041699 [Senna tora]
MRKGKYHVKVLCDHGKRTSTRRGQEVWEQDEKLQCPSIAHQSLRLAHNTVAARRRRFNHRQRCEQQKKLRAKQSRSQREIESMKEEQEIRCRSLDSVQKKLMDASASKDDMPQPAKPIKSLIGLTRNQFTLYNL